MSQDGGATWSNRDDADFTTEVAVGDTVQWLYDLNMNDQTNDITGIVSIAPTTYFNPGPNRNNSFTGTVKSGNPNKGTEDYTIRYNVSGVNGTQSQDPKIKMK
ncbi:hypothetical protein [Muriicola soli]|uniref:Uncharacterized protein n=1 Tax=Muriicola soli TaxID=2507538 RepID=A0A411E7X6_9FLAO|nr:hypothetical protein [Muriicola soli]QBA63835.1 hypothetical protein EQY75_04370 [Muriicola soli]